MRQKMHCWLDLKAFGNRGGTEMFVTKNAPEGTTEVLCMFSLFI